MIFQFAMLVYQRVSPWGPLHDKLIESLKIPLFHLILLLGWMLSLLMVIIIPNNPGSIIPSDNHSSKVLFIARWINSTCVLYVPSLTWWSLIDVYGVNWSIWRTTNRYLISPTESITNQKPQPTNQSVNQTVNIHIYTYICNIYICIMYIIYIYHL